RLVAAATGAPPVGFLVGVALGALAQSNTAATLIVVALADGGALGVSAALPVVYGTNLGAIGLRWVLSAGLRGSPLRLVRFEDLFCVCSGVLMLAADLLERGAHVPLVAALVEATSARPGRQVALAFVVSNLLPALALAPALGALARDGGRGGGDAALPRASGARRSADRGRPRAEGAGAARRRARRLRARAAQPRGRPGGARGGGDHRLPRARRPHRRVRCRARRPGPRCGDAAPARA